MLFESKTLRGQLKFSPIHTIDTNLHEFSMGRFLQLQLSLAARLAARFVAACDVNSLLNSADNSATTGVAYLMIISVQMAFSALIAELRVLHNFRLLSFVLPNFSQRRPLDKRRSNIFPKWQDTFYENGRSKSRPKYFFKTAGEPLSERQDEMLSENDRTNFRNRKDSRSYLFTLSQSNIDPEQQQKTAQGQIIPQLIDRIVSCTNLELIKI